MKIINMKKRELLDLSLVLIISITFTLFSLSINFIDKMYNYFHALTSFPMAEFLINIIFLWLIGLLWTTYCRWREAIKRQRELEDIISSISPDVLMVVDRDRNIIMCNASVKRMFGYEVDEVINQKTDLLYLDRRSKPSHKHEIYDILENIGFHMGLTKGRKKNGNIIPIEIITSKLSGREGAVLLVRNISEREKAVESIKLAYAELMQIFNTAAEGICVIDKDFNVLLINDTFTTLSGMSMDEMAGKKCYEVFRSHLLCHTRRCLLTQILGSEERIECEIERERNDGTKVFCIVTATPFRTPDGELIGIVENSKDITERILAETTIKETENRLNNIIESSLDGIVVSDHKGFIIRVNKSFLKLLGRKEEEAIGKHIAEFSPLKEGTYESTTGELVEINEEFFNSMKTWMSRLVEERKVSNLESYLIRNDNKVIPIEENIVYLYNEEGNISGAVGIIRDITERRKAEKEIKEKRDFLKSVIEGSKDAIIITDEKGYIISVNTAGERIYGLDKREMIGKHSSEFTIEDKDERRKILEKMGELFEKGSTTYETRDKTKNGKYINIECNSSMIKDDNGNYIAGVSIIRDVSERKKMEHKLFQSEKLKSLGELAGGVAHDFNNILAAILGRAQLLKMIVETPPGKQERRKSVIELKKGLEIIERASKDGAETVRRIQEFSRRREEDKYYTNIDLSEIIESALEFTRMRWKDDAESKGIKINIKKELSHLPSASGSAAELREVITNLVNNAIDAMPQGGDITIKTFKKGSHICIKVKDTGDGIPQTIRDRIFDPFFTTRGVQSSGLGLSVSYGIINRHRGNITVESVEGKGTTFIIKLPISEKVIEEEKAKPISGEQKKARILVIEDEEQVLNLLSAILINGGHQVETATDGSKGIKLFKKKEFDLVFTDLGMPRMSGWQVAEKVKGINRRVPVALITGWNVELKESEMRKSGVDLIIYKPFEVNQVLRLVQEGMLLRDRFKAA